MSKGLLKQELVEKVGLTKTGCIRIICSIIFYDEEKVFVAGKETEWTTGTGIRIPPIKIR